MEEVDSDPAWPAMRKVARKLFRGLGALRDAQVMEEWVKKLAPESDPVRTHLQASFESNEPKLRENALRLAGKFDQKSWKRLERALRQRSRRIVSLLLARPASGTSGVPASPRMAVSKPPLWLACAPRPAPLIRMCAGLHKSPEPPSPSLTPSSELALLPYSAT
jgi:hypothetical protein